MKNVYPQSTSRVSLRFGIDRELIDFLGGGDLESGVTVEKPPTGAGGSTGAGALSPKPESAAPADVRGLLEDADTAVLGSSAQLVWFGFRESASLTPIDVAAASSASLALAQTSVCPRRWSSNDNANST